MLVVAAGVERVAGKVQVVLEAPYEVLGHRADLDEVGGIPRASQRDRVLAEQSVDVRGHERLAVAALLVCSTMRTIGAKRSARACSSS